MTGKVRHVTYNDEDSANWIKNIPGHDSNRRELRILEELKKYFALTEKLGLDPKLPQDKPNE